MYYTKEFVSSILHEQHPKQLLIRRNLEEYSSTASAQELFNFIAFLCWYLFLLICCIIPTICAYRRRGCLWQSGDGNTDNADEIREADANPNADERWREEDADNDTDERWQRQTDTIIGPRNIDDFRSNSDGVLVLEGLWSGSVPSNTSIRPARFINERVAKRIKKEIILLLAKDTNTTVLPTDLILCDDATTFDDNTSIKSNETPTPNAMPEDSLSKPPTSPSVCSIISLDSIEEENNGLLVIPQYRPGSTIAYPNGGPRNVPSTCAICLSNYKEGDTVIWSPNTECCHAFHDDCVVMWLLSISDNEEYVCPCCRQIFFFKKDRYYPSTFGPYSQSLNLYNNQQLSLQQFLQSPREGNEIPSLNSSSYVRNNDNNNDMSTDDRGNNSSTPQQQPQMQLEIDDDAHDSVVEAEYVVISS